MPKDKTERIFIRVSPTEKKKIEEKAALVNKSVASYLIELSESKRIADTSKLPPLILEIRRIGVNINQIAAVANSQKYINNQLLSKIDKDLKEVIGLLQKILAEVYNTEEHTFQSLEAKIDNLTKAIEGISENGSS